MREAANDSCRFTGRSGLTCSGRYWYRSRKNPTGCISAPHDVANITTRVLRSTSLSNSWKLQNKRNFTSWNRFALKWNPVEHEALRSLLTENYSACLTKRRCDNDERAQTTLDKLTETSLTKIDSTHRSRLFALRMNFDLLIVELMLKISDWIRENFPSMKKFQHGIEKVSKRISLFVIRRAVQNRGKNERFSMRLPIFSAFCCFFDF